MLLPCCWSAMRRSHICREMRTEKDEGRIIVNITVIINRGTNKFEDYSEALSMESLHETAGEMAARTKKPFMCDCDARNSIAILHQNRPALLFELHVNQTPASLHPKPVSASIS